VYNTTLSSNSFQNYCYSKVEKYDWTMTGNVTLVCEVYIGFIFDND